MKIKSINPANNSVIKEYESYSDQAVNTMINQSHEDFLLWKLLSFDKRRDILLKMAQKLKDDVEKHAKMISLEMGKPIKESRAEVLKCVWVVEYYAKNASDFLKPETIKSDYSDSYIQYDPIGIVLGVMP